MSAREHRDQARELRGAVPQAPWLRLDQHHFTVELNVRAAAGKQGLLRIGPTGPIVALHSAPQKGRANRELIEFIAEVLAVPPAAVSIIKGHGTRRKVVRVETSSPPSIAAKLVELTNRA